MTFRVVKLLALGATVAALSAPWTAAQQNTPPTPSRRAQLELALARERLRLLREDREAAEIHARIMRLYDQLAKRLSQDPKIRELQTELEALDAAPDTTSAKE